MGKYIYVCLFALEDIMPFIHVVLPLYTLYVCVIRVVQTHDNIGR